MNLTGVKREPLDHPPAEVPRHAEYSYFRIETGDPQWRRVRDEADFAFYLPDAEAEVDVHLYVVLPRGKKGRG
jgi:predicted component of type VI protein secretion system